MSDDRPRGPGLKWRKRRSGELVPYWFASERAVELKYPLKSRILRKVPWSDIPMVCKGLQAEMNSWLRKAPAAKPMFDGFFRSLLTIYETDPESSFSELKSGTRESYLVYLPKLKNYIGEMCIDQCDGTDVKRWFKEWRIGDDGKDRLPRANFILSILKAAVSHGVMRRFEGVKSFQDALRELEFPKPKRRKQAPTAEQITAARQAAVEDGAPARALVYSLQFEPTVRQWDIIGVWVPLSDPRPSTIHDGRKKWIGPMWSAIDENGILKIKPTKTEDTTEVETTFDLMVCPMVQEDLARIPLEQRHGPLIVDHKTGLPYRYQTFHGCWKRDFKAAGLPADIWGRDLRAAGVTEGGKAGASKDDRRKLAGHSMEETTEVYDRDMIEAHRRVMAARVGSRNKNGS